MTARKTPGAKKAAPRKAAKKAAPRKATKKAAPRKAPAGANSSAATATPPQAYGYYTDARMAEEVARAVFTGKFIYTPGVGWHRWTGKVWEPLVDETQPVETVRRLVVNRINYWAAKITLTDPEPLNRVYSWKAVASRHRLTAITTLARGLVEVAHEKLDAHPDLLNTPGGVVDMSTGAVRAHDQDLLLTRITRGNYRPGFTHPDVEKALKAIDEPERTLLLSRIGQGATGYQTPDDVFPILRGEGSNGKTALFGFGLLAALGGYAQQASAKLFAASERGSEHSTEMADLRGCRLVLGEEMQDDARLNITVLKRITAAGIRARYCHQDNISFDASHSLFLTSNPRPRVTETDDGTWRRLALFEFPYRFVASAADIETPMDRVGDIGLRERLRVGKTEQHDAIVTLVVEGAMRWYVSPQTALLPTAKVKADTADWRSGSDRILGYWNEFLIGDPDAMVSCAELLEHFNDWLKGNGHHQLAVETFMPKFAGHNETRRNNVERTRIRGRKGLSRPPHTYAFGPIASGPQWMWSGVRYRTAADDVAAPFGAQTAGGPASNPFATTAGQQP